MEAADLLAFDASLRRLCLAFNRAHSDDLTDVYFTALKLLPIDAVSKGVEKLIASGGNFPNPRTIWDMATYFMATPDPYAGRAGEGFTRDELKGLLAKVAHSNSPPRRGLPPGVDTLAGAMMLAISKLPYDRSRS